MIFETKNLQQKGILNTDKKTADTRIQ